MLIGLCHRDTHLRDLKENKYMVKAVLSVIGCDRVGIIAAVSGYFAKVNVNILDIS